VLYNTGKFAEAKTRFEAATKADPSNAIAFYQLRTGREADKVPDVLGDERHEFLEQILHDSYLNPGDRHDVGRTGRISPVCRL